MAKKQKRAQMKYIKMGADLKRARNNYLIALIASVIVGVAFWCLVSFTGINDHTILTSGLIYGATVILVFGVGIVGNRFASQITELNKLKREYGVTDEDIAEYQAKHK